MSNEFSLGVPKRSEPYIEYVRALFSIVQENFTREKYRNRPSNTMQDALPPDSRSAVHQQDRILYAGRQDDTRLITRLSQIVETQPNWFRSHRVTGDETYLMNFVKLNVSQRNAIAIISPLVDAAIEYFAGFPHEPFANIRNFAEKNRRVKKVLEQKVAIREFNETVLKLQGTSEADTPTFGLYDEAKKFTPFVQEMRLPESGQRRTNHFWISPDLETSVTNRIENIAQIINRLVLIQEALANTYISHEVKQNFDAARDTAANQAQTFLGNHKVADAGSPTSTTNLRSIRLVIN